MGVTGIFNSESVIWRKTFEHIGLGVNKKTIFKHLQQCGGKSEDDL